MYWFTKAVAGDRADVEILVPPGTEIHEYQTTPENIKTLATANVLVKNGLGLEDFLADAIKSAENPQLKAIDASQGIKPLDPISPVEKIGKQNEEHHHHDEGNPHVWLDPLLVIQQVNNIRDGLIAVDPQNSNIYQANALAYVQKLKNLHTTLQQGLQKYPNCKFVTFHDAYPYLAKRYNLKQVAIVKLPEDQLSPGELKTVVNTVKKYQVKALFGEPGTNNKLLDSLSQDLNLTLRPLDALESGDKNPQYYFRGMEANLGNLVSACE
jgi:zinc/manganese transport system substrate-binding protein